jgi:hypothetical protein
MAEAYEPRWTMGELLIVAWVELIGIAGVLELTYRFSTQPVRRRME